MNTQIYNRIRQLTPLSREHEDGMEFVKRIQDADSNISIDRLRDYTCWYWKNHIRPHFYQEERILLPYLPVDHPLAKKLKEDHADIRDLILALDFEAEKVSFEELCDLLVKHIAFEEKRVFPYLEHHLSETELNSIHKELQEHPVHTDEWKDVFWK